MRKLLLIAIFIWIVFQGFTQENFQSRLYFNDGTTKEGYTNLVNNDISRKYVYFRKEFDSKENEKIPAKSLNKIVYFNEDERYEYHYLKIFRGSKKNKTSKPGWFKLVQKGYVSLFTLDSYMTSGQTSSRGGGNVTMKFQDYYIKRKDETALRMCATRGGGLNNWNFRVLSKRNFADYPELVEKIKNKEYTIDDLEEVVRIYSEWLEEKEDNNNNINQQ